MYEFYLWSGLSLSTNDEMKGFFFFYQSQKCYYLFFMKQQGVFALFFFCFLNRYKIISVNLINISRHINKYRNTLGDCI